MIRQATAESDSGNYTWADEREARQREFLALLSKIERQKPPGTDRNRLGA